MAASLADQVRDFVSIGLFLREVIDRHISPLACKRDCGRTPDSGIAARYQGLSAAEPAGQPRSCG